MLYRPSSLFTPFARSTPAMDSFDGLLPAVYSFFSHHRSTRPPSSPAHHTQLANSDSRRGSTLPNWRLLRQSSISSVAQSTTGCLQLVPSPVKAYARVRRKMRQRVLSSTTRFYSVNATYNTTDGAGSEPFYHALEGLPPVAGSVVAS